MSVPARAVHDRLYGAVQVMFGGLPIVLAEFVAKPVSCFSQGSGLCFNIATVCTVIARFGFMLHVDLHMRFIGGWRSCILVSCGWYA